MHDQSGTFFCRGAAFVFVRQERQEVDVVDFVRTRLEDGFFVADGSGVVGEIFDEFAEVAFGNK